MKKKLLTAIALVTALVSNAQYASNDYGKCCPTEETQGTYIGIAGGTHTSIMSISDIDKDVFPTNKSVTSGTFSIFLRQSFGSKQHFAIRPEISFVNRGGKITDIYSNIDDYYEDNDLKDVVYSVAPRYIDLRIPLMYRMCSPSSSVRPYIYIAPVLGACTGGHIRAYSVGNVYDENDEVMDELNTFEGVDLKVTKANMNSYYVAGAAGVGLDFAFNMNHRRCYLGVEANYEYGLLDTYGDDNKAKYQIPLNGTAGDIKGTRKFSGFEVKLTLGIPLGSPKAPAPAPAPAPVIYVQPELLPEPLPIVEVEEVKPCYTLDEIIELMQNGVSVQGKTICAIDDAITFDFGKSNIRRESYDYLNRLAETLKRTYSHVVVKGHTDNVGSDDFNMNLSRERAIAVYNYLISCGVPSEYLDYEYYGMTQPITTNATEEGRRMNRRVEFEIKR